MSTDLTHVFQVDSLARPSGRCLLAARFEVQRNLAIRATFEERKGQGPAKAGQLAAEIEPFLSETLDASPTDIAEACRYLADEYLQVGDALLVIDRRTGKAIARITEDDFWEPPPVPRESGSMAKPLPRLRPDLQGYLIKWVFDRESEDRLLSELSQRVHQTQTSIELGDPRLLASTLHGRKRITEELRQTLPVLLPGAVNGRLRSFLDLLAFTPTHVSGAAKTYSGFQAVARVTASIADAKARNLLFDVFTSHRSAIAAQWTRDILRTVARIAHDEKQPTAARSGGLLVAAPNENILGRHIPALFVDGVPATMLSGPIGCLALGQTQIAQREVHDRWEVAATLDYDIRLDLESLWPVVLGSLPIPEARAQVLR